MNPHPTLPNAHVEPQLPSETGLQRNTPSLSEGLFAPWKPERRSCKTANPLRSSIDLTAWLVLREVKKLVQLTRNTPSLLRKRLENKTHIIKE